MATSSTSSIAYVREDEAPKLPPPPNLVGVQGWVMQNLFSSIGSTIVTILFGSFLVWLIWSVIDFAFLRAAWSGENRDACLAENMGACWPMVVAKMPQWIYGFYPVDQRWRVNVCFITGAALLIPMLMPSAPYKLWNILLLLIVFPMLTLIMLTGGNFAFGASTYELIVGLLLLASAAVPLAAFGIEEGINRNRMGLATAGLAILVWLLTFITGPISFAGLYSVSTLIIAVLMAATAVFSLIAAREGGNSSIRGWLIASVGILIAMLVLDWDFGLVPVDTPQWGGLTVTLVVSISGIVASLPVGILLALGRRSQMPIVRILSVTYIEFIRGVPLITVLFMASVMLPLFLPPGTSFDKLLRALIGVAMFSSAYMAEVVRGGLQAIPKGQYEGAMALGLSYGQMMTQIILPQALKVSIPNIVGNFISLFKDTTLVLIIGLFDLLGFVQAGLRDANWATASSAPTGYFTVALMYWVFCFGMSRYSIYTERRLNTGHRR